MVSSNLTEITYRNVYCAICNGELDDGLIPLVFWMVHVRCKKETIIASLKGFSLDRLIKLIKKRYKG